MSQSRSNSGILSRRGFLKSAAATAALSTPFARLLSNSVAQAQTGVVPLRLLVISTPLGTVFDLWRPRAPGGGPNSGPTTGFDISFTNSILAPLAKYRDKMIILDGVDLVPQIKFGDFGHQAAGSILTGDIFQPLAGTNPKVQSLDQYLAAQPQIGGVTPFRSLEISVGGNKFDNRVVSWGPGGSPLPRLLNPWHTFSTIFSKYKPPGTSGPDQAMLDQQARYKSVLDFIHGDVTRIRARVGKGEQMKLDQHLQAVSDLQRRLMGGQSAVTMGCAPPTAIPNSATWKGLFDEDPKNNVNFDSPKYGSFMFDHVNEWSDLQLQLVAQALACDLTRVITLQYFEDGCDGLAPWALPDVKASDPLADPHVCTHTDPGTPTREDKMKNYQLWYSRQIAKLFDMLSAMPEGNGTVLDNTLVLWTNENGEAHEVNNVPIIIAGGTGGKYAMGRYLKFSREMCTSCSSETSCGCSTPPTFTPHNKLLVSVGNAFPGVNLDSYGNTAGHTWSTGGGLPLL